MFPCLPLFPPKQLAQMLVDMNIQRIKCNTARVFRSDSPGEAAQWLAISIRES
jgi:hypothetical protein